MPLDRERQSRQLRSSDQGALSWKLAVLTLERTVPHVLEPEGSRPPSTSPWDEQPALTAATAGRHAFMDSTQDPAPFDLGHHGVHTNASSTAQSSKAGNFASMAHTRLDQGSPGRSDVSQPTFIARRRPAVQPNQKLKMLLSADKRISNYSLLKTSTDDFERDKSMYWSPASAAGARQNWTSSLRRSAVIPLKKNRSINDLLPTPLSSNALEDAGVLFRLPTPPHQCSPRRPHRSVGGVEAASRNASSSGGGPSSTGVITTRASASPTVSSLLRRDHSSSAGVRVMVAQAADNETAVCEALPAVGTGTTQLPHSLSDVSRHQTVSPGSPTQASPVGALPTQLVMAAVQGEGSGRAAASECSGPDQGAGSSSIGSTGGAVDDHGQPPADVQASLAAGTSSTSADQEQQAGEALGTREVSVWRQQQLSGATYVGGSAFSLGIFSDEGPQLRQSVPAGKALSAMLSAEASLATSPAPASASPAARQLRLPPERNSLSLTAKPPTLRRTQGDKQQQQRRRFAADLLGQGRSSEAQLQHSAFQSLAGEAFDQGDHLAGEDSAAEQSPHPSPAQGQARGQLSAALSARLCLPELPLQQLRERAPSINYMSLSPHRQALLMDMLPASARSLSTEPSPPPTFRFLEHTPNGNRVQEPPLSRMMSQLASMHREREAVVGEGKAQGMAFAPPVRRMALESSLAMSGKGASMLHDAQDVSNYLNACERQLTPGLHQKHVKAAAGMLNY